MNDAWYQPLKVTGPDGSLQEQWTWGASQLTVRATDQTVEVEGPAVDGKPPATMRYLRAPGEELELTARTADRSIVARPATQLVVLAEGTAIIYVSSPLWVGIAERGTPPFAEFPTHLPKQTWLGATPQAGQLAYASRTRARADLNNITAESGRMLTQVELVNHLDEPWAIERVEVPMPHLAIHLCEGPDGKVLWTNSVRVERSGDTEVDAHVADGPPASAGPAQRLAEPRVPTTPRLNLLALGRWGWL